MLLKLNMKQIHHSFHLDAGTPRRAEQAKCPYECMVLRCKPAKTLFSWCTFCNIKSLGSLLRLKCAQNLDVLDIYRRVSNNACTIYIAEQH